jgi:hypothetical protein
MNRRLRRGESHEEIKLWAEKNILAPIGLLVPEEQQTN